VRMPYVPERSCRFCWVVSMTHALFFLRSQALFDVPITFRFAHHRHGAISAQALSSAHECMLYSRTYMTLPSCTLMLSDQVAALDQFACHGGSTCRKKCGMHARIRHVVHMAQNEGAGGCVQSRSRRSWKGLWSQHSQGEAGWINAITPYMGLR
jgi:hypothetical protein